MESDHCLRGVLRAIQPAERLKALILRQAVQDNLDAIHERLPSQFRPARGRLSASSRWTTRAALLFALVAALSGVGLWSFAAPAGPVVVVPGGPVGTPPEQSNPAEGESLAAPRGSADSPLLSRHFSSGVLALPVHRVIIDAGHGGDNLGASSAGGLQEKDLTLDIAERAQHLMVARGFDAVLTRSTDETLSLQQRAAIANRRRGDIFVSIHVNSLKPSSARGIETYYLGPSSGPELDAIATVENQHSGYTLSDLRSLLERIFADARRNESRRLADSVQQALVRTMRKTETGLADRGVKTAPFVVLVATEMPAILTEVSCLSNADEARRLSTPDYRQAIAEALVSGVKTFARESRLNATERTKTSGS
jgi:N-acetylmuramoyl-L-alanine amidase